MCLNAIKWANIKEVYYAADRNDADTIGFRDLIFYEKDTICLKHIEIPLACEVMQKWYTSKDKKMY